MAHSIGVLVNQSDMVGTSGSGILGSNIAWSKMADSGQPECKVAVLFDKSCDVESDVPGFRKRIATIDGSTIRDACGVMHAGAMRIEGVSLCDNLGPGMAVLKERTMDEKGYRPLPSPTRITLNTSCGSIAGMHCTGSAHSSDVLLCPVVAGAIENCSWKMPTDDTEELNRINHLTCKWVDHIDTPMDRIAHSCVDATSAETPMFGIPLAGSNPCCLAKFTTDLYSKQDFKKVAHCFGDTTEVVRNSMQQPMVRVRGEAGIAKVMAAKQQLYENMRPAFLHDGMHVIHYCPESVPQTTGLIHVVLKRRQPHENVQTQQMIAEKLDIALPVVVSQVASTPYTQANALAAATVIPNNEAARAITTAAIVTSTPSDATASAC
jgi:hypothetical protein